MDRNGLLLLSGCSVSEFQVSPGWGLGVRVSEPRLCLGLPVEWGEWGCPGLALCEA